MLYCLEFCTVRRGQTAAMMRRSPSALTEICLITLFLPLALRQHPPPLSRPCRWPTRSCMLKVANSMIRFLKSTGVHERLWQDAPVLGRFVHAFLLTLFLVNFFLFWIFFYLISYTSVPLSRRRVANRAHASLSSLPYILIFPPLSLAYSCHFAFQYYSIHTNAHFDKLKRDLLT